MNNPPYCETMGPGFFMFFQDFESEIEFTPYGGPAPSATKIDYKKDNDEIIALTLLLTRQL